MKAYFSNFYNDFIRTVTIYVAAVVALWSWSRNRVRRVMNLSLSANEDTPSVEGLTHVHPEEGAQGTESTQAHQIFKSYV
ncbi:hypothetical protein TNCV_4325701 [Trichonephila clavipes]|nr:hypothetical protein TNCV_4325701 [Trichonephila clavipes]